MKLILIATLLFHTLVVSASVNMVDIPVDIFFPNSRQNFDSIFINNENELKDAVLTVYNKGEIGHEFSKAYDKNATFEKYFAYYKTNYNLLDINNDGVLELIFNGSISTSEEKELFEIFALDANKQYSSIYNEDGKLTAYQIHPNNHSIILYLHKYPCCNNSSHNLYTIRYLNGKIKFKDKFFVGRDDPSMVGPFFPKSTEYPSEFSILQDTVVVYWSPEIVEKGAWMPRTETNKIISYATNSVFKPLFTESDWTFVLMYSAPILESSRMINAANFSNRPIYGWVKDLKQ